MGKTLDALPPGWAYGFDRKSSVTVTLLHDGMTLTNCTDAALLSGTNLMLVGRELIQFGRAERIGPAQYRLSHLLRGRRGTDGFMEGHQVGEEIVLILRDTLVTLDCPAGAQEVQIMASGIADAQPVTRACAIAGLATAPLSPVRLTATRMSDGTLCLSWIRRSRDGWNWADTIDAPLAEESERYRITMAPDAGAIWTEDSLQPKLVVAAGKISSLRAAGATRIDWSVRQLGVAGQSAPATARLTLN